MRELGSPLNKKDTWLTSCPPVPSVSGSWSGAEGVFTPPSLFLPSILVWV